MKRVFSILGLFFLVTLVTAVSNPEISTISIERAVNKFKLDSKRFSESTFLLQSAIEQLDSANPKSVISVRQSLMQCRMDFKALEYFIEYFFPTAAVTYNMPPVYEIEEPNMEYTEPIGLQVIESLLNEKNIYERKMEMLMHMKLITSSAEDINSLLFNFKGNDQQLLESIHIELIRVLTLGISGFDASILKTGIKESWAALRSVKYALQPFLSTSESVADSVSFYLDQSIKYLFKNPDFDSFDRLHFYTDYALPLQSHFSALITRKGMEINTGTALNKKATQLFSTFFFNRKNFSSDGDKKRLVELGRVLFFEKTLSGNGKRSCASCHNPNKYFTDGLAKSRAFDNKSFVARNSPTILYAAFQYSQRWDGFLNSLEDQITSVLFSREEMNSNEEIIHKNLAGERKYREAFKKTFNNDSLSSISANNVAIAIAAFIGSAAPFNSDFDKYINGDHKAMTPQQKKGFNLFMGKAKCGTCHFAPLFNGLLPPLYNSTEVEVIGVPKTDQLDKPVYDEDRGRYNLFPTRFYEKAFKTPGLRNVSETKPYMHNGAFNSLETVMDFYNKGGGNGIGLIHKNQTLSDEALNLSKEETENIISFMNSLTDSPSSINQIIQPR